MKPKVEEPKNIVVDGDKFLAAYKDPRTVSMEVDRMYTFRKLNKERMEVIEYVVKFKSDTGDRLTLKSSQPMLYLSGQQVMVQIKSMNADITEYDNE